MLAVGAVKYQLKLQTSFTGLNFIPMNVEKVVRVSKLRLPTVHSGKLASLCALTASK
jgi:hypothetical protein